MTLNSATCGSSVARPVSIALIDSVVAFGERPEYQSAVACSNMSIVGRAGVDRILEPAMSHEEKHALQRSADTLRSAVK